jgi:RimJ/RimL family protein N-acetyltransferase
LRAVDVAPLRSATLLTPTDRLILRRLLPSDLDSLYALYSDPEIRQVFPEGTLTHEEIKEVLERFSVAIRLTRSLASRRPNQASIKVARKIGMTLDKAMEDEKGPFLLYSKNKQPSLSQSSE